jgi:hypothetical protein
MVPADCAQRAACSDDAGNAAEVSFADNVDGTPAGPEAGDIQVDEPIGLEAVARDADAASEDVVVEMPPPPPPSDGSCNSPYTCAAPVPSGWTGPALLWTDTATATPPTCPTNYLQQPDLGQNLAGTQAGPCTCSCGLSDNCIVTVSFHPDQGCSSATCLLPDGGNDAVQVAIAANSCVPIPDNLCGSAGSVTTTNGSAYVANCVATVAPIPTASFRNSALLCSTTCSSSAAHCVIGPTSSFHSTACIFKSGDAACPTTAYVNKSLFYTGFADHRSCGPCTCNGYDGGTCVYLGGPEGPASSVTVYALSNCDPGSGSWMNVTLDVCSVYNPSNSTLASNPASLTYAPTIMHGACSGVASPSQPGDGGVVPTGATTVCCM